LLSNQFSPTVINTEACKVFDESPTPKLEGFFLLLQPRIFHRSVEGREEEMEDTPGNNANLLEDREDGLIKGLMKALQDIAEGQRETQEFMGKITGYALGRKHGEERGESSKRGQMEEGGNTHKPHIEVITSRTNPQNRPHDYSEIPRSTSQSS
jgi:hypothetical protein